MSAIASAPPFRNLIRFLDSSSVEHYGDIADGSLHRIVGSTVQLLEGNLFSLKRCEQTAIVHKVCCSSICLDLALIANYSELLCPLPSTPLFVCVGLNYVNHATEANIRVLRNCALTKTICEDALTGPDCDVNIPVEAELLDYEGEICIVISKTGKDIPEEQVRDHVLGFTAGNDLSSRYWQRAPRSGGQFCFAKSFDDFAPIGPTILHTSYASPTQTLELQTRVNGELRQKTTNHDMIFDIEKIVSHISKGTTLRQGTVIMTGTPAGVAAKWKGGTWLKDGDVVEVEIKSYTPQGFYSEIAGVGVYHSFTQTVEGGSKYGRILFLPDGFGLAAHNIRLADISGFDTTIVDYFEGDALPDVFMKYVPGTDLDAYESITPQEKTMIRNIDMGAWQQRHTPTHISRVLDRFSPEYCRYLRNSTSPLHPSSKNFHVVGHCFGGKHAFQFAKLGNDPGVLSAVIFHPSFLQADDTEELKRPVFVGCAETDVFTTSLVNDMLSQLPHSGSSYKIVVYGGTKHGFASRPDPDDPEGVKAFQQAFDDGLKWLRSI
ncbi:hypothetical protein G7046_g3962 [Stylonectria norvegica]|nr:hypothetical protein G7046_g3962 [Stylonectria norvegica]